VKQAAAGKIGPSAFTCLRAEHTFSQLINQGVDRTVMNPPGEAYLAMMQQILHPVLT
jgi:hypothetical protein